MGACGEQPTYDLLWLNSLSMTQDLQHCILQPGLVYKHCRSVNRCPGSLTPLTGEKAES